MSNYELTCIISPNLEKEELKKIYEAVLDLVKKNKGEVTGMPKITDFETASEKNQKEVEKDLSEQKNEENSPFVKKKLAYPIKQAKSAYYTIINFEIEPSSLGGLEEKLRLQEQILRYLILKKEIRKVKKTRTFFPRIKKKEEVVEVKPARKKAKEPKEFGKISEEEKAKPEKKEKKKKIKLEDIQEKLDKILDI